MRRRDFMAALGGAVAWPLAARAQHSGKLPTIGFLGAGTPSTWVQFTGAFVQRLRELGWIEGSTVAIEYRWAEGRSARYPVTTAELARLKVDVIVTGGAEAVLAAKKATSDIPIVFAAAADPVGTGLVASLARPGGNVTGLSVQYTDLVGKRLELLRELLPGLRRLAIMANVASPSAALEMREARRMARALALEVVSSEIRGAEDIEPAFEAFQSRVDGLYVCSEPLVVTNRTRVSALALRARLPTMHGIREHVEAGGLMSYGPNFLSMWRRAADYADKILRGARPGDIPVEQPTKFDLVVNLKTAQALGLTIPPSLLARADEVIE